MGKRAYGPLLLLLCMVVAAASPDPRPPERPGGLSRGVTLLPNGWRISPAGRHMTIGHLPLALAESPDGKFLAVTNNGYSKPSVALVDPAAFLIRSRAALDDAWLGLAWNRAGDRLYCSGASDNSIHEFRLEKGKLAAGKTFSLGPAVKEEFLGGLALSPDGTRLYAVNVLGQRLSTFDLTAETAGPTADLPAEPYACAVSPDGRTVVVSLWGGARLLFFDTRTLGKTGEVAVGEHPNALAFSSDGSRIFVACANTNSVWVVDARSRRAIEQISVALYPKSPAGSTPNALALSPDGRRLLVANADNNTVAMVDVSRPGQAQVEGFVPTGWYPTAVQLSRDGRRISVLSGKGLTSQSNPRGPQPGIPGEDSQYSGALLQGSLSILSIPDARALAAYTKKVYEMTPYSDATRLKPARAPAGSPIPGRVGGTSPVKHVFYVIRENRTYDQILGDLPRGNGDPNLCLFGEDTTPNAHALASEFVLLDNFFVNAEVSYDGHAFSTGAYATDAVEKIWPPFYGRKTGRYLSEGGGTMRNPYGNLDAPAEGYIWDACQRAGVGVRSYGEFVLPKGPSGDAANQAGEMPFRASVPGLEGKVSTEYPPYDLTIPDNRRVEIWLKEFREFERNGKLPALSILRLGGDHTLGTRPGAPTPRSMIAENDLALGRLVEAISKSRYWKDSAIFVLEDDAQNGPDHVDAHRSVALVASPYARRGAVDSTLYTTCGMLRTMELILGLPPLSQYDAAATPMYRAFGSAPDPTPFEHRDPRVPLDEKNDVSAPGAAASLAMDFREADLTPEIELNEILWKSVRGPGSPMPPPIHSAFVRPLPDADD